MRFNQATKAKRIIALILSIAMVFSNMAISVVAEETGNQSQEEFASKTYYRYREKTYTTSTEELDDPWILYNTTTVYTHGGYTYIYLDGYEVSGTGTASGYTYDAAYQWKLDNYDKYCFHGGPTEVYKYMKKTSPYNYIYVTSVYDDVDYTQYSFVRECWRFQICSKITESLKYHYYQWGEWSEWSETPVTETDDVEVETKTVALFTIIYDANGGMGVPEPTTKEQDVTIILSEIIPTRENHQFLGWSTTSDGNVEYAAGSEYSVNENVTLYAVWKNVTEYTVTYDANGGTDAPAQQNKTYGENITLSSEIPTREGYTFLGWSTASSGEVEYAEGSIYEKDESVVLFAVWSKNKYTVSFDANGGYNAPEFQIKTHDEDMIITSEKPTSEGAGFLGWSLTSDGSVQYEAGSVYSENSDMILYAVWEQYTYTITYYGYGCTNAPAQQIKTYNIPVTLSEQIPERQWHTFLGWAIKEDGEVVYNPGDTYSENSDITLYPVWQMLSDEEIIIASGYDSNELYDPDSSLWWKLSRAGTLTLTGYGTMRDFQSISTVPWEAYREKIKKVVICSGISSIGDYAFSACVNLTEVIIPDSILTIGDYAFYYTGLTELAISDSVTTVGTGAFSYCDDLVAICIGKSVKNFPYSALSGCDKLLSIQVSEDNPYFSNDAAGALLNKNQTTLIRVPGGIEGQYIIPNSTTKIGTSAFNGCANLLTVIIPDSVTSIGTSAFGGCSCLSDVYYFGTESQWSAISIGSGNSALDYATVQMIEEELQFSGAALTLHNNLSVNYKVDKALFEAIGYVDPYVIFEFNGLKAKVDSYTLDGDKYLFSFTNIAPNQMTDTIYATLYASFDGVVFSSETKEYSVATYCYNMLEKCSADEYAEFRTLLVDLLHYGAASQTYTNYNTDVLANAELTATQLAWGTGTERTLETVLDPTYLTVETPKVEWKGAGLNLQDAVTMRLKFSAESIEGLTLKVESEVGTWMITSDNFVETTGAYYAFFSGLNAAQMSETVYLTFYEDDTPVSNTARYSIESYAYSNQNSADAILAELLKAMMHYGDSAHAYIN